MRKRILSLIPNDYKQNKDILNIINADNEFIKDHLASYIHLDQVENSHQNFLGFIKQALVEPNNDFNKLKKSLKIDDSLTLERIAHMYVDHIVNDHIKLAVKDPIRERINILSKPTGFFYDNSTSLLNGYLEKSRDRLKNLDFRKNKKANDFSKDINPEILLKDLEEVYKIDLNF